MIHKLVPLYIGDGEYYTRIDADNVIAEKDAEIAELKNLVDEVNKDFDLVDNQNERLLKIVRHQKYKRCLAMAKWCEAMRGHYLSYEEPKWFWYRKWSERWLELAAEPTWAKFLQLIHKEVK